MIDNSYWITLALWESNDMRDYELWLIECHCPQVEPYHTCTIKIRVRHNRTFTYPSWHRTRGYSSTQPVDLMWIKMGCAGVARVIGIAEAPRAEAAPWMSRRIGHVPSGWFNFDSGTAVVCRRWIVYHRSASGLASLVNHAGWCGCVLMASIM